MQLGQMIVKMRKDYGLTQDDFAQKFNVTRQTVSNWENEKSYPDLLTLVRISDEFDCSLDVMLKENNAVTKDLNKKIKYGEESALIGGISSICLFIIAIIMIVLQYGSPYMWVTFLLIAFLNTKAISITLDNVKKEGRKTIVLFLGFICIVALLVFGVISYIR